MTYLTFPGLGHVGRLGNQMWQIASTVGMARRLDMQPLFPPSWRYRDVFSIPDEMFGTESGPVSSDLAQEIDPSERPYLQHRFLWEHVEEEVLALFAPSEVAQRVMAHEEAFHALPRPILSIHVRRGDLVQANNPGAPNIHLFHPLRPARYFLDAMKEVGPWKSVAVFGEDPDWNRANIPGAAWYSDNPPDSAVDWVDLFLMAQCNRHILSNSTYGIWAAYLSRDADVIYPSNWYGPNVSADPHAMFLPSWREIPCPLED